ncbi:MAG TPA: SDR family NAD(P)-dependent oxidoreductase [Vicinamibacterales bacterium]|nr:SDR family NAD(P)-dependent oxidoreductase [Vicinamibacterales bacterium]
MNDLTGRIALVTGANRGLGRETAHQLAARGAVVLLGARDRDKAANAARAMGLPADHAVQLDVTSAQDVAACAALIRDVFEGRLDVLINNAAIHYDDYQTALAADLAIVREALETNVIGAWRVAQMAAQLMTPRRWGRIVNVSSEAGAIGSMHPDAPAYRASKIALNGLTRMLAEELRPSGILVNAVCPGWVATDMGGPGGRPIPDGAQSIVWAACLDDDGPTGGFFRDGRRLRW